ncbi:MAG: CARDB domain-containing protein [Planctomycetota bacterium]
MNTLAIRNVLGLAAVIGGGLAGCSKADLTVTDLTVTDYTSNTISYEFAVENIDYGETAFAYPGSIDGRIRFEAVCSSDGIAKDGPAAGYDSVKIVNPTLLPGEQQPWRYTARCDVDTETYPYLLVTVDPDDRVVEYDEKNNSMAAQIEP